MTASVISIFNDAKAKFTWADDSTVFGEIEHWATVQELVAKAVDGKLIGDCDDFATICVTALRAADFPGRYILCKTETNELHLVAESDGIILDNRQNYPTPIDFLKYDWIACSGEKAGDPWHTIEGLK